MKFTLENSHIIESTVNNSETKVIRKSVNVFVRDDLKYIVIYEVRAIKTDGETITIDRYLNQIDAESQVEFAYKYYKNLYSCVFIREHWVWC